jgi:hypothetical protein
MSYASMLTFLPTGDCPTIGSFGRSVKLQLVYARTVIPGFSLLEIHDQDFYSLLDMCFDEGGVGLPM